MQIDAPTTTPPSRARLPSKDNNMNTVDDSLEIEFEGCKLTPYLDTTGIPTSGYGNTHNVVMGVNITQAQADTDLLNNLKSAINTVEHMVHVPMTDGEESALVDFVYNCGSGNFQHSTLLRLLNAGDYAGAAAQFDVWDKAGGVVLAGLLRRRQAETDMFKRGVGIV